MSGVGLQEEHEIRSRFIKLSITLEQLSLSNSHTRGLDYCNLFFYYVLNFCFIYYLGMLGSSWVLLLARHPTIDLLHFSAISF